MNFQILTLPLKTINREIQRNPKSLILTEDNGSLIVSQIVDEVASGNFQTTESFRELFRAVGFVNLWFFLKFIAGFAGPFDQLNSNEHLDMCNFAHGMHLPGSKNAIFMPRSGRKSTVFTIGDGAWSLIRNPDEAICLFSGIFDRAMDFLHTIQRIFDSNELFAWLYPEYVGGKINDGEMILPNRSRHFTEPSVRCGSVGGSGEGQHFSKLKIDDPVGLEQLDSMRRSNADMHKRRDWILSAQRTLLRNWKTDIVDLCATRYAVDDAYEPIMKNVKSISGYTDGILYEISKSGEWNIYYRCVEEYGKLIMPEIYSRDILDKMDPWDRATQYDNNPQMSGLSELSAYDVKIVDLDFDKDMNEWAIVFPGEKQTKIALSECDFVAGCDPAGADRYVSSRTSRSAVVAIARDSMDRRIILELFVDYAPMSKVFDELFKLKQKFEGYLRKIVFEAQGGFKAVGDLLSKEQSRRGIYLGLDKVGAVGDKDVRIRAAWELPLSKGLVYVARPYLQKFQEEQRAFPQSLKKDILDAGALAMIATYRPPSVEEVEANQKRDDAWDNRQTNAAGY